MDKEIENFISILSHQFKTPITRIKLVISELLGDKNLKLTNEQKEYLEVIKSSNQEMLDLLNKLREPPKNN